jgi:hypothetical protein
MKFKIKKLLLTKNGEFIIACGIELNGPIDQQTKHCGDEDESRCFCQIL